MSSQSPDRSVVDQLRESIQADDASRTAVEQNLLDLHPELRARINEPIGPFDWPALSSARIAR